MTEPAQFPVDDPLAKSEPPQAASPTSAVPTWSYPSRMCRICHEDVWPEITMYPPGLPPAFQRPLVEYKNDDEYGRLIRPCKCRGGMRYIHELCLKRSRIDTNRPGSLWKCHECGHQFNFKRLTLQRYMGSTVASAGLTVVVMVLIMFVLGFFADPIINLYVDPYDTLVTGNENLWSEIELRNANDNVQGWGLHFLKGLVSMGLMGFLKTALLNPFQWWNLRGTGWISARSSGTATTGRDRAASISWIAIVIGISSAFYFFYQWVQTIIGRTLQRIGNNIVDTQLPGDDDDLKPPPGWKPEYPKAETIPPSTVPGDATVKPVSTVGEPSAVIPDHVVASPLPSETKDTSIEEPAAIVQPAAISLSDRALADGTSYSSALENARDQEWSFVDI